LRLVWNQVGQGFRWMGGARHSEMEDADPESLSKLLDSDGDVWALPGDGPVAGHQRYS
jgi:hypothetical protein